MKPTFDPSAIAALESLAPRRINTFIKSGWIESVKSARPINSSGEPIPWFTYPAIEFLERKVKPSWNVLEWGSGNSTLWWAARAKHVTSIEHDLPWFGEISASLPANTNLLLVENPEAYTQLWTIDPQQRFDLIVIDGEHRNACAVTAQMRAKGDAMIVLDNSDRPSLREAMLCLRAGGWRQLDFFGLVPSYAYRTCTSIFYRGQLSSDTDPLPCDFVSCLGPTLSQTLGE